MAIVTYSDLQTAIANWMVRDDLTSRIPDFIDLFEARINRMLRVRQMETTASLTPSSGVASLPADFLEWRSLTYMGTVQNDIEYVVPSVFTELYPDTPSDTPPTIFTIVGSSINMMPIDTANTTVRLDYYATIAQLSVSNTTNWLLTAYPDLYLFGSLVEGFLYIMDPDASQMWKARADEIIQEIVRLDAFSRAPSSMRVIGSPTP